VPTRTPPPVAGELRLAVREDIKTLNPYLVANASEGFVVSLLYDTLLDSDSHGELEPNLAERWELTPDSLNLTLWRNPLARWHDDQPVTADDVVFSFDLVGQQEFPGLARLVALVDRVEATSPREVRFVLLAAQANAVRLLTTQLRIVPAHVWKNVPDALTYTNRDEPVGSGPFRLVEFVQEERVVLRNIRTHHCTRSRAETIFVQIVRDEDRALQALKDDELDAIGWDIAPSLARDVLDAADDYVGIQVAQSPGVDTHTLLLNLRKAPYDNPTFRQALAQAIDAEVIVETVFLRFGDVARASLFPATSPWRNANIPPIAFNPEEAMSKLDAAGFRDRDGDGLRENPDGSALRIPISCVELPVPLDVAELVAVNLQAVGLSTEVSAIAQDEWMPMLMQAQFDVVLYNISLSEPEMTFFHFHSSRGALNEGHVSGFNYGGYANPEFDEITAAAQKEQNPVKRQELLYQLQDILATDLPQIPLYSPHVLNLFRSDRFTRWQAQPGLGLLHRTMVANLRPVSAE